MMKDTSLGIDLTIERDKALGMHELVPHHKFSEKTYDTDTIVAMCPLCKKVFWETDDYSYIISKKSGPIFNKDGSVNTNQVMQPYGCILHIEGEPVHWCTRQKDGSFKDEPEMLEFFKGIHD